MWEAGWGSFACFTCFACCVFQYPYIIYSSSSSLAQKHHHHHHHHNNNNKKEEEGLHGVFKRLRRNGHQLEKGLQMAQRGPSLKATTTTVEVAVSA
jgi:hypothetical protein